MTRAAWVRLVVRMAQRQRREADDAKEVRESHDDDDADHDDDGGHQEFGPILSVLTSGRRKIGRATPFRPFIESTQF